MAPDPIPQTEIFTPTTPSELSRFVRENAEGKKQPLYPVGGRTALDFGYPPETPGVVIPTTDLKQTVDYPARDMTVTVEAGLRIDELVEQLKAENQQLPIDVPQTNRATVGGVIATNTSGPRRFGYGTLRDYVIGISAVDGTGRLFQGGGRVVKNVAGYDFPKMLVGSLGTLGVIAQVTFKLKPLAESQALVWATFRDFPTIETVLDRLMTSATRPVMLEVLDAGTARQMAAESRQELPADRPVLLVGFEGIPNEIDWQIETLQDELVSFEPAEIEVARGQGAEKLRVALTEFQSVSEAPLVFKANLPPSRSMEFADHAARNGITVQVHAGNGIVIGHLPDEASTAEKAAEFITPLRALARETRGNLVVLHCDPEWKPHLPVFGEPEPSRPLMKRLKSALDPHGVLNPGRFLDRE